MLATDGAGNFYLQVLSWQENSYHIQVYSMDHRDLGRWRKLSDAVESDRRKGGPALDKPAMAVDENGRVAIAYTAESEGSSISFVMSTDGGKRRTEPMVVSSKSKKLKTGAAVSMFRNYVVVSWMEGAGLSLTELWYAMSEDGGVSFRAPAMIYRLKEPLRPPLGYAMGVGPAGFISNNTWLTYISEQKDKARFYLACTEGAGKGSRILLFTLTSGTTTWSHPVPIGSVAKNSMSFFPSLVSMGNRVAVLFYYREGLTNALTDVYLSFPTESSTHPGIRLNSVSSDWARVPGDKQFAPVQRNFGDYITLASDGNILVAVWTDGRSHVPRIYARTLQLIAMSSSEQ